MRLIYILTVLSLCFWTTAKSSSVRHGRPWKSDDYYKRFIDHNSYNCKSLACRYRPPGPPYHNRATWRVPDNHPRIQTPLHHYVSSRIPVPNYNPKPSIKHPSDNNRLDNAVKGILLPHPNEKPKPNAVSLSFVIDSTGSMYDEIKQVKEGIYNILLEIKKHQEVSIHDYVLVFFNDPFIGPYLVTKDPWIFMRELRNIVAYGGGDCEERSLKGLQLAVNNSVQGSYIFVFTDAAAKDYNLIPELESVIQQKQIQVIFVLTGDCGSQDHPGYQAYKHIALMSSGQVFNLKKFEVKQVIDYVNYTIHERNKINILSEDIPNPGLETYIVPVDSQTNSLTVSLSGKDPTIHLENPVGKETKGNPILNVNTGSVVNVAKPDHGNWSVVIGSTSNHHVQVSGTSEFSFSYGFSNSSSVQLEESSMNPVAGTATLILIRITNQHQLYNLTTLKLKNYSGEVIESLNLHHVPLHPDLYRTSFFMPPQEQFYLQIFGVDNSGFIVERMSPTAISPAIIPVNTESPPIVQTESQVNLTYDKKQEIQCPVASKQNYTVNWFKATNNKHYIRITSWTFPRFNIKPNGNLVINPVMHHDRGLYKCFAESPAGKFEHKIHAEVIKSSQETAPVQVKVLPKKTYFSFGEVVKLSCTAEGSDELVLQWRKNGKLIKVSNSQVAVAGEKHVLNLDLENANETDEGHYECMARNNFNQDFDTADIVFVQYPTVTNKTKVTIQSLENSTVIIHCNIQGKPKPTFTWFKNGRKIKFGEDFQILPDGKLLIQDVQISHDGAYTCYGENFLGQTQQTINLNVGLPPQFLEEPEDVVIPINSSGSIPCHVKGKPKPEIKWKRENGKEIDQTRFTTGEFCTLMISDAKYEDEGIYTLSVENSFGAEELSVYVSISGVESPVLRSKYQETKVDLGEDVSLPCYASGVPPPEFQWMKDGTPISNGIENILNLYDVQQDAAGVYTCQATNIAGKTEKTFRVIITGNSNVKS